jgi:hypothetical protein
MFCCEPIFGGRVGSINRWDGSLEHQWGSHDIVVPSTTPQKKDLGANGYKWYM